MTDAHGAGLPGPGHPEHEGAPTPAAGRPLNRLTLHAVHERAGARFAPFAGWNMPLQYGRGPVGECEAVRNRAGIFDVSHLGRAWLTGDGAADALRSVSTYDVRRIATASAHYSLYCNDDAGIADDVFVYRVGDERWLVVHNAANAAADLERLAGAGGPPPEDVTASTVMLAVQGPGALAALERLLGHRVAMLRRHECRELSWRGGRALVVRTGYTGEDGAECILDAAGGEEFLADLLEAGVEPAGLAARDILRTEAALPLHGNDIGPWSTPFEAGLGFAVTLDDEAPFTGRDALLRLAASASSRRLSCVQTAERAVLRPGYTVTNPATGEELGRLTSGTFSPTLERGIGMAYLPAALCRPKTSLAVRVRSNDVAVTVVPRPFYQRR